MWRKQNLNSQQLPHIWPSCASYEVSIARISEKKITLPQTTSHSISVIYIQQLWSVIWRLNHHHDWRNTVCYTDDLAQDYSISSTLAMKTLISHCSFALRYRHDVCRRLCFTSLRVIFHFKFMCTIYPHSYYLALPCRRCMPACFL